MSKISKAADTLRKDAKEKPTVNFMGGISYKLDPIQTLKMIAASSIFGEPQYYRRSKFASYVKIREEIPDRLFADYISTDNTVEDVFTQAIDDALTYDFYATLKLAVELRKEYNMRLNPQVIAVRAAIHPKRKEFTDKHHGVFNALEQEIMRRADEPAMQIAYCIFINGSKANMPSILKRAIATKLEKLSPYEVNKYKNAEIGMVDTIRIVHASSPVLSDLLYNRLTIDDEEQTWEQLRSQGASWKEIISRINIGHMALLRNLKNIASELDETVPADDIFIRDILTQLKDGVIKGKQFPYRYHSAYKKIDSIIVPFKTIILDTLEECIDISIDNMKKLPGKTVALTDNSGSAWGGVTSEYGTTTIAEIDNLSSVIAVRSSDSGYVIKFGDTYKRYDISRRNGILSIAEKVNETKGIDVGHATEGGIWEYLQWAIDTKEHIDNLFIFSDCQAGTGELYGTNEQAAKYMSKYLYSNKGNIWKFIDVYKMISDYRRLVNPKVNVFCVQTAGYDNTLLPQYTYRFAALYGWTGKEVQFANEYIKQWNDIEREGNNNFKV